MTAKKPPKLHWMRVYWIGKNRGKTSCGQNIRLKKDSNPEKWVMDNGGGVARLAVYPLGAKDVTCTGCRQALDREAIEDTRKHHAATFCPI